jgi:hypothetical protein
MNERNEMQQRLKLPLSARLMVLGNALLVVPALWRTVKALKDLTAVEPRLIPFAVYRTPLLAILMGAILISIAITWRGSHRAANWMLILFSVFVGVCIWESATTFGLLDHVGIDFSEIGIVGWFEILWGVLGFVWLGLNIWYFYGRRGMVPRTS